jgi:membrane protein
VLLVVESAAWVLNQTPDASAAEVRRLVDLLLPPHPEGPETPIHLLLDTLLRTRGALGVYSAVGFVWFTTRLFGSLRAVLAEVFDIEHDRGIVLGKLFDVQVTVVATALMIAYFAISVYLAVATSRGIAVLQQLGIRTEVMGGLEYVLGRLLAFLFIVLAFYAAYKYLPNRKITWKQAFIGAATTGVLFELARNLYTYFTARFDPGSLYTGTLYAVISIVFWVYYASLIFILGGEVGQAYAVRRRLRLAKE